MRVAARLLVSVLVLLACGGNADGGDASSPASDDPIESAGSAPVGVGSPSAPGSSEGEAPAVDEPIATSPLPVGAFPFVVSASGEGNRAASADSAGVRHFVFGDAGGAVDISTHLPGIDLTRQFASVALEVRSSRPMALLVSTTPLLVGEEVVGSYAEERDGGYAWHMTEVAVEAALARHELPFAAMQALGAGQLRPLANESGTMLHLVVLDPNGAELWLHRVELRP